MREIEIKVRVSDRSALLAALKAQNINASEPVTQRDQVFGLAGVNSGGHNDALWLRIRTETKGSEVTRFFTLKKSVTNQMDSIEHETEVADAAEMEMIVGHLGFTPYSDLTKTRQKAHMGDIEICIDTVEGLGDFVEAEKLTEENADYNAVAEELWALLEKLGARQEDQVHDGYDVLMRKHQGIDN